MRKNRNGKVCRKFKMSMLKSMVAVTFCSLLVYPFATVKGAAQADIENKDALYAVSGSVLTDNQSGEKISDEESTLYKVLVNDELIGYTDNADMAEAAYLNARLKVSEGADSIVYMDASVDIEEYEGKEELLTESELEESIYQVLKNSIVTPKQSAYALRVGEVTIYLEDREAVYELFEKIKDKYDLEDAFEVVLSESDDTMFSALTAEIVSPEREEKDLDMVYSSGEDFVYPEDEEAEPEYELGIAGISFEENIEIIESYVPTTQILTVDEAFEFLTKENEEKQMYTVVKGDSMWKIAKDHELTTTQLFALNEDITEKSVLQIGQKVVITVPEPELSVLVEEVVEYEEEYNAPVEYVYNDSWYTTKSVVLQEPEAGYHIVTANVATRNGREYDREILEEIVVEEPVAKVVEIGTITPPTFIRPVNGGRVTSNYGYRAWQGKVHTGIDYGISTGTKVMASCGGTVIQAGWNGGYGYCVTIQHANGIKTRYAHLSKVYVSVGQKVSQGERIALSGNTGNSTGPHLHFEVIVNGSYVDPRKYLN